MNSIQSKKGSYHRGPFNTANIETRIKEMQSGNWFERAKAAEALAAAGPEALKTLLQEMQSHNKEVRYAVTWAVGQIGGSEAVDALCQALDDPDWTVREVAARALGECKDQRAHGPLREAAQHDARKSVRYAAKNSIEQLYDLKL